MYKLLTALYGIFTYPFRLFKLSVAYLDYDIYTSYGLDDEGRLQGFIWSVACWVLIYSALAAIFAPIIFVTGNLGFEFTFASVTFFYGSMMWLFILYYALPLCWKWAIKKLK